jgi:hypothetical protein
MLLVLAPILLFLVVFVLGMLAYALGLTPHTSAWLSPRASAGLFGGVMLWFATTFVRMMLRDTERWTAEREARDALLREQNIELWRARQLHEAAVQEKTAAILTALRQRPLHVRLRTLLR